MPTAPRVLSFSGDLATKTRCGQQPHYQAAACLMHLMRGMPGSESWWDVPGRRSGARVRLVIQLLRERERQRWVRAAENVTKGVVDAWLRPTRGTQTQLWKIYTPGGRHAGRNMGLIPPTARLAVPAEGHFKTYGQLGQPRRRRFWRNKLAH